MCSVSRLNDLEDSFVPNRVSHASPAASRLLPFATAGGVADFPPATLLRRAGGSHSATSANAPADDFSWGSSLLAAADAVDSSHPDWHEVTSRPPVSHQPNSNSPSQHAFPFAVHTGYDGPLVGHARDDPTKVALPVVAQQVPPSLKSNQLVNVYGVLQKKRGRKTGVPTRKSGLPVGPTGSSGPSSAPISPEAPAPASSGSASGSRHDTTHTGHATSPQDHVESTSRARSARIRRQLKESSEGPGMNCLRSLSARASLRVPVSSLAQRATSQTAPDREDHGRNCLR